MDKAARDFSPVQRPVSSLSSLLRELNLTPKTKSPEDAANEAADRIIRAVEKERAKKNAPSK